MFPSCRARGACVSSICRGIVFLRDRIPPNLRSRTVNSGSNGYRSCRSNRRFVLFYAAACTLRSAFNGDLYFSATNMVELSIRDVYVRVCVCVSSSSHGLFKVNHGGVNVFMVRLFYRARMCIDSPSASLSLFFSPSAFAVFSPRS